MYIMSPRRYEKKRHADRRAYNNASLRPEALTSGFSLFRQLDESQAIDIRSAITRFAPKIPGMRVRGYGYEYPASMSVVSKAETKHIQGIKSIEESFLISALFKHVPSLREKTKAHVSSIDCFGKRSASISIVAASSGYAGAEFVTERGNINTVLCEMNDWNPVILRPAGTPHVTFAILPGNTAEEYVTDLQHTISEIIPDELILQPATFYK